MELFRLLVDDYLQERSRKKVDKKIKKDSLEIPKKTLSAGVPPKENKPCDIKTMKEADKLGLIDSSIESLQQVQNETELYQKAKEMCDRYNMTLESMDGYFYVETAAGRWRFVPGNESVTLYHKNYNFLRKSNTFFHVQYTKEESIEETLLYIYFHDRKKGRNKN